MRCEREIIIDAFDAGHKWGDRSAARDVSISARMRLMSELESDREDAYAYALALALLTWLHGTQEPDARAELDAWMQAGIDAAKAKPNTHCGETIETDAAEYESETCHNCDGNGCRQCKGTGGVWRKVDSEPSEVEE